MKNNILIFMIILLSLSADEFNIDAILEESTKDVNNTKIELQKFLKDSQTSATKAQEDFYYQHQYVPESEKSTISNDSYCYGSGVNEGRDKNMCLANATKNKSYCYGSGINEGRDKNMCLASATGDKSYCYGSGINEGRDKNMCLASATGDKSYCYGSGINEGRDKNMCLAQTR